MQLEAWYSVVAFIQGIFLKIVDDMYDNNLFPDFKFAANVILQLITIYILFFTEYFGLVWSVVIVFGGAALFDPSVDGGKTSDLGLHHDWCVLVCVRVCK